MTGVQTISLHHGRPRYLVLWLLVLELQPALYHHAIVPPTLSSEGKAFRYSPRLSEVTIARHRRSEASLGALRRTIELRLRQPQNPLLHFKSASFLLE